MTSLMECNGPIHSSPWLRPLEALDELLSICGGRSLTSLMTVNIYSIYSGVVNLDGAEIETADTNHPSVTEAKLSLTEFGVYEYINQ